MLPVGFLDAGPLASVNITPHDWLYVYICSSSGSSVHGIMQAFLQRLSCFGFAFRLFLPLNESMCAVVRPTAWN